MVGAPTLLSAPLVGRVAAQQTRMLDAERTDRALLRLQVLTQVFFWVPSALIGAPDRDPADRLDLHARAALALFEVSIPAKPHRARADRHAFLPELLATCA